MKKLASLLLALALLLSLAACGGSTGKDEEAPAAETEATAGQPAEPETADAAEDAADAADKASEAETAAPEEPAFAEVTAADNDEYAIKITDIEPDNPFGYTLKVQFENKSAEKTYTLVEDTAQVNGVQCTAICASVAAAGETSDGDVTIMRDELADNGVGAFTDIELSFRVYDSDDLTVDPVSEETVHIAP